MSNYRLENFYKSKTHQECGHNFLEGEYKLKIIFLIIFIVKTEHFFRRIFYEKHNSK
ncbi:hypothetical protein C7953_2796 [Halanaerobium congolense]|uniref:hypothetical protein n=1 Tax=Halanaerobium congolense TaxID=54121 RepID=UPI000D428C0C|nr:hypothetical protein [Halanaerobium congolense]PTX14738.1 hypothetical protein C7953_2796 [Halanaerobium congolense]